jgi:alkaline phosphatase
VNQSSAVTAGYTVVTDHSSLLGLATNSEVKVWGQFGDTYLPYEADGLGNLPHLSEMTQTALEILDNDPDGFFLMIEGGRIDHAGHDNNIYKNIFETIEFSRAAQKVLSWADGRNDTLVIITADHETGGLSVIGNNGAGNIPKVTWQTTDHTGVDVPIYAWGVNAYKMNAKIENTDIFNIMLSTGAVE